MNLPRKTKSNPTTPATRPEIGADRGGLFSQPDLKGIFMSTKKQKLTAIIALLIAFGLGMATMCGCAYFTREKVAAIHKTVGTVLDIAYTAGGATLVEQKIDATVTDGKITAEQAVQLKAAARKSYEALQAKLAELAIKDVTVETAK